MGKKVAFIMERGMHFEYADHTVKRDTIRFPVSVVLLEKIKIVSRIMSITDGKTRSA